MLKARLTGDWSEARAILGQADRLKKAIDNAVMQEAQHVRREIVKGITSQAPGGQRFDPLSPLTLALRRAKGFRGKKILMVSGGLRNSITVKRTATGKVFVGVLRSARGKDGRNLYNVASVQENGATIVVRVTPRMRAWLMIQLRKSGIGTRQQGRGAGGRFTKARFVPSGQGQLSKGVLVIKIPARPFMRPVIEQIASDREGIRKRFAHRVSRDMGLALGKP